MKTFIVLGSGNSGASAIHDYLLSREDFQSPFNGKEFRLVNDPNGLDDLYNNLYNNFSINRSANSSYEFLKFIINSYESNYNKKKTIYSKDIINIASEFINNITKINYNGSPQFYFDKISKLEKIKFYFCRFILNLNSKKIKLLDMRLPTNKEVFLENSRKFILEIFRLNKNFDENKNIVIEQGGNFWKPISSTKYYDSDSEVILVTRDPKAIFWSMKRRNSLSYPSHDIEIFVKWYNFIMKKIDQEEIKKVTHIKFENFFENFEEEKEKLSKKLNVKLNCNHNFDLNHTKKNLYKYKKNLSNDEIDYINSELSEYIQC